jgi:hypothetical protein
MLRLALPRSAHSDSLSMTQRESDLFIPASTCPQQVLAQDDRNKFYATQLTHYPLSRTRSILDLFFILILR